MKMKPIVVFMLFPILFACNSEKNTTVKPQNNTNAALIKAEPIKKSASNIASQPLKAQAKAVTENIVAANGPQIVKIPGNSMTKEIVVAAVHTQQNPSSQSHIHGHTDVAANAVTKGHVTVAQVQVASNSADVVLYEHD